jgi:hypothetical protein
MRVVARNIPESELIALKGRIFVGETVEFSKVTRINAAQDCRFTDCEIVIDQKGMPSGDLLARRFWFRHCDFERCTFIVRGLLRRLELCHYVSLVGCTLKGGPLIEPTIGVATVFADSVPEDVRPVTDCDFTQADLRDALFHRVDASEVRLAGWPWISVLAQEGDVVFAPPSEHRPALTLLLDQVSDFDWGSDDTRISMRSLVIGVGVRFNERQIQVCHAETVAQRARATVEQVRAALDRFGHPAIRY